MSTIQISPTTFRRYILGQQGLWPGRRWQGKIGVAQALQQGSVVQIDPLNLIARSHDIALFGRVLDYNPALLDNLLYQDRIGFDYGGTVFIRLMKELPYWRVVMERNSHWKRWENFAKEHSEVIARVREEIEFHGSVAGRDLKGNWVGPGNYRGSKDTGLALYYLWFIGELMTAGRRYGRAGSGNTGGSFERLYDLRERVALADLQYSATPEQADDYFAMKVFSDLGLPNLRDFRQWYSGNISRVVLESEAIARIRALKDAGTIDEVTLRESADILPRYILSSEFALLEELEAGNIPAKWLPVSASTLEEMTVLAPLEIVSARKRAKLLFNFDYVWEVYKPLSLRRWGYYTLPLLWKDQLVARFDSRLEKKEHILRILGFWVEPGIVTDDYFCDALWKGMRRFAAFLGAEQIEDGGLMPK